LRGLSKQETARRGNVLGTVGMMIAVGVTAVALVWQPDVAEAARVHIASETLGLLGAAIGVGCIIGAVLAARVGMTSMPELVAILHSFVGLAAVLVGISTFMVVQHGDLAHSIEVFIGVFV